MNTKIAWIALIIILLVLGAWLTFSPKPASAPTDSMVAATSTPESEVEEDGGPAFATITLTDAGFTPASVTVSKGETVRFINQSSRGMWVGSDDHPTHTDYDGTSTREHCADGTSTNGTFDQCASVATGEFWDYTFEKAGTFGFHNHVGASSKGEVVVK